MNIIIDTQPVANSEKTIEQPSNGGVVSAAISRTTNSNQEKKSKFQFLSALIALLIFVFLAYKFYENPNIDWNVFRQYVFSKQIIDGLIVTLELSFFSLIVGLIVGLFIAIARMSKNPVLSRTAFVYIWLLRGLPSIVQLLFWGNIALFVKTITIAIPLTEITLISIPVNSLITPFAASILGLGLVESAYMSEIIRGGISNIDKGQWEAGEALAMGKYRVMRRIILPQAMISIIPAMGNQLTTLIKASALVSVIAGGELLTTVQNISAENFRIMEMLFVASFWYLLVLGIVAILQHFVEAKIKKSNIA